MTATQVATIILGKGSIVLLDNMIDKIGKIVKKAVLSAFGCEITVVIYKGF